MLLASVYVALFELQEAITSTAVGVMCREVKFQPKVTFCPIL